MSKAHDLANVPDKELLDVLTTLPDASEASQSTAVHERDLDDGSRLTVTSVQGGEAVIEVIAPPDIKLPPAPGPPEHDKPLPPIDPPPASAATGQLWPRGDFGRGGPEPVGQLWPPKR